MDKKERYKPNNKYLVSELVETARAQKFRTASAFWEEHQKELSISYSQYAAVESSKRMPDISLTLEIAKILGIEERLICHAWAKDHMPTPETRSYFEPAPGTERKGEPLYSQAGQIDNYYVIQESQIKKFLETPKLWEVASVISVYSLNADITEKDVARLSGIPLAEVKDMVEWLRNENLVLAQKGVLKRKRKYFHIPNLEEFRPLRDQNFLHASQALIKMIKTQDLLEKKAYRVTLVRRLSEAQIKQTVEEIDQVVAKLMNLPEEGPDAFVCTIALGRRYSL
ncbi:MAG: hypothetical protein JST16_03030 [Bdellovibrionales bacterium]|nr:hypothetical protein [Bdellovibrionales bacterium]